MLLVQRANRRDDSRIVLRPMRKVAGSTTVKARKRGRSMRAKFVGFGAMLERGCEVLGGDGWLEFRAEFRLMLNRCGSTSW